MEREDSSLREDRAPRPDRDRESGTRRRIRQTRGGPLRIATTCFLALGLAAIAAGPGASRSTPGPGTDEARAVTGHIGFVGRNVFATANGTFHEWELRESRIDLDRLEESFARVEVALESVDTGNDRRDAHLRSPDFFGVERHPVAIVHVHSPRFLERTSEGHPLYEARFDLDLHGVEKELTGRIELASEDPLVFEGELTVDRTEFGIGPAPSRWSLFSIDPEIPVRFRVELPSGRRR